jgi:N-acetyl sugar amidotransferase
MKRKDVRTLYNLPPEIRYCTRCVVSNQRPRITFDEDGVCSACRFSDFKRNSIDWEARESELRELCDRFRSRDGSYDVVVPCSGGKDGGFVAHQLKYVYGMHPLCVTWAPLLPTEVGRRNLDSFIHSGFNHVLGTPDPTVTRRLTRVSFLHVGDPFQPFIYGQTNFPLRVALQNNIRLIMYGENGEVEYGGDMKNALRPTRELADHDKHYFSGLPPEFWSQHGFSSADLFPFTAPDSNSVRQAGIEIHFLGYYKFWDPQENYYYCREHTGFSPNPERSEGTYSKYASLDDRIDGFHYYLGYIKFGIGRTTSDAAHEIRDGKITREEGVALVRKFDGEFPARHFQAFLDYCSITADEFHQVVDSWRSDHIWSRQDDQWQLRHAVWMDQHAS